jgi:site-specific recombinase XerD
VTVINANKNARIVPFKEALRSSLGKYQANIKQRDTVIRRKKLAPSLFFSANFFAGHSPVLRCSMFALLRANKFAWVQN